MTELEQLKAIRDNAPEGATHYTDEKPSLNLYVKAEHLDKHVFVFLGGKWEAYPIYGNMKSMECLNRQIELIEEVESIRKQLATAKADGVREAISSVTGYYDWEWECVTANDLQKLLTEYADKLERGD